MTQDYVLILKAGGTQRLGWAFKLAWASLTMLVSGTSKLKADLHESLPFSSEGIVA